VRIRADILVEVDLAAVGRAPDRVTIDNLDPVDLPLLLARVHRGAGVDIRVEVQVHLSGIVDEPISADDPPDLDHLMTGAGFRIDRSERRHSDADTIRSVTATRLRSLPDYVSGGMRVLICGLNPSLHSADLRVGFGRSGNRFWPAALAAGLLRVDRDPIDALVEHGIGMTDMVKRATPRAASLTTAEYAAGVERLETLCEWLRPGVVCMVGLAGWRAAVDRRAVAGVQPRLLGSSVVYLMPSTSGLNAHSSLADLTVHLRTAADLARGPLS